MSIAGSSPGCGRSRPSASSAASPSAASRSWLSTSPSRSPPARPACAASSCPSPDASCSTPPRTPCTSSAAGAMLANLDIQVVTAPALRLDLEVDRRNLAETVDRLRPRLLILDPFVRLHRIDENASGEVAPLLAYLRELQRRYGVAVLIVHHARKGGACVRAGQALRGSSEFHAWGDSNLYLRRDGEELTLTRRASRGSIVPAAHHRAGAERSGPRPGGGRAGQARRRHDSLAR